MQTLNTFLKNIDDPETPSNSAKYSIAPVRKIKLTKKGQRDTGSPPTSISRQRDTGSPSSLKEDIPTNRTEHNTNPTHDLILKVEPLMTHNDSHDMRDQEDKDSQIVTVYSGEYVESVSDFCESESESQLESESESELESEYGEKGWIQEDSRIKVEKWIQTELKEENLMTWTPMKTETWTSIKTELISDIDVKSEPIEFRDSEIEIPNSPKCNSHPPT